MHTNVMIVAKHSYVDVQLISNMTKFYRNGVSFIDIPVPDTTDYPVNSVSNKT
jgi:hypothetical protein